MSKFLRLTALSIALAACSTASFAAVPTSAPTWATAGYTGASYTVNSTDPNTTGRDPNGNRLIVNGELQTNGVYSAASQYSSVSTGGSGGAGSSGVGAGFATATAIGNLLNVDISGNNNVVVINSNQNNSGKVSATATLGTAKVVSNGP